MRSVHAVQVTGACLSVSVVCVCGVCVCVCVWCVCVVVCARFVTNQDIELYNDTGMTQVITR